jgi:hypothetical protein
MIAAIVLLTFLAVPLGMWGQTTYEQLTSIANIDESAQYVLGIDGTGFHYSGTSSWGLTALPSAQTPIYYTLTKANDGNSFTAKATISGTLYYLQVPTSNTFSMATSTGTNTDLIIGTTQISETNYAVANKDNTNRHLRINGTSGLRSYAGTTGTMAYFYKVVVPSGNTYTVTYHANVTGATDIVETYNEGATVTIADNTFSNPGYAFTEWNTESDGSGDPYNPGDEIEDIDDDLDLYAQWEESDEATATLTATNLELTGSYTTDTEKTIDGITYVYSNLMKNNGNIQAKASVGTIKNTTAYPGDITSVVITHTGNANSTTINGSADGSTWTQVATGNGSITADFSGRGYKYFQITRGSNAAYWTKIEITYSTGGGSSQTTSDLAITGAPVALSFDLYNNNSAQTVSYTTSSTGAITISPASPTSYFSYVHDAANKTIIVTPLAVTPSAQTVTISQAADDDYYAGTATFTVSIANSTPLANIAALTANNTAGTYSVTLSDAVVTFVNGSNAYIQDASGAVMMHKSDHGLTAGDVFNGTATVTFQLYNANPQITEITGVTPVSGTAPNPTEVAQSAWSYTFNNVLSQYFKVTGATITQSSNKYYVSLNNESIQLYKSGGSINSLDLTKTYSITGFPTLYNSTKELTIYADPEVETSTEPSVTVTPNTINAPAEGAEGMLALTYENITDFSSFDFYFCDAEGEELQEDPDWIDAEIQSQNNADSLYYFIDANDGEARTAYMKVYTYDDELEEVSAIVTVNQAQYVVDYATLPFAYDGDGAGNLPIGFTVLGLGTYSSSPAMKFDGTGDYAILKFNERPGILTFDIKGYSFSGGTFTVQTSENGTTYTDLATYNSDNMPSTVKSEEFTNLGENVRYIKWIYTNKSSGNVALGNISLTKYVAPTPAITVASTTITATAEQTSGTLYVTCTEIETEVGVDVLWFESDGTTSASQPDWMIITDITFSNINYLIYANNGEARTAYFKLFSLDADANDVYSDLVTVTQAAYVAPPTPGNWVLTSLANLTADDIFVIVGTDADDDTFALPHNGGTSTAPAATAITIVDGTISGEPAAALQWNLSGNATDGYTFYPNGTSDNWLYCTATNNGVRVGTNTNNKFEMDEDGYMVNKATFRVLSIYINSGTPQDWRCYGNYDNNAVVISFYKKVVEPATDTYTKTIEARTANSGWYLIASPLTEDVSPATVGMITDQLGAGATSANASYDLYYFDQTSNKEWKNYRTNTFNLEPGKGYLYANVNSVNLTFSGEMNNEFEDVELPYVENNDVKSLYLAGNSKTTSETFYVYDVNLDQQTFNCLTMNEDGDGFITNQVTSFEAQALQGFFVHSNGSGWTLSTVDLSNEGKSGNVELLNIKVGRNRGTEIDNAIVSFSNAPMMNKFYISNNSTRVYIPQNDEDMAVVRSEGQGEMPVNFKANKDGEYTLTVSPENVEMNYLHLIDNMTGMDIDLLQTPSYTFEASTRDYASRFRLVFNANNENGTSTGTTTFAYYNGSEWVIANDGTATLQVVDMMGRVVSTQTVNGNATLNANGMSTGVYVMRLVNGNEVKTQKIVVK